MILLMKQVLVIQKLMNSHIKFIQNTITMQKYEILSVIGQGAYGVVLKCKSNETKEILAIKKFKQSEDDELVRKVTMREVKILKNMKNPNVVQLRDAFRRKGIVYLVFEYVENNLLQILEKSPEGLEPQLIKNIMYQLIKGLAYMHSNNVIHRDIKPENLLISETKELKICDFGFARSFKKSTEDYTDYVATRWYRPPELLVGAPYDSAIDIWAVGSIMAELIDGNPLFPGENQFDQLFLIQKCLGNLNPEHFQIFLKNPRFIGMKFPEITNLQTIEKRYLGKLSQKALNFLKSTLKLNPSQRITAVQALKHPYFDSIRESDILRKYSVSHNYTKGQNRISNSLKEDYPNSVSYERKKIQTNMYNPPGLNMNLEREREREREREKTEESQFAYENMLNTKGGVKVYQQPQNNNQGKVHKKSRDDIKNFELTTKGFHPIQSKSVNKTSQNGQGNHNPTTKVSKLKEKYISLQKGQHNYNRDHVTQTQAGFYKNKIIRIDFQDNDEVNLINSNKNRASNRVYNAHGNEGNYPTGTKSRNAKNRSILNTEEIFEEDEGTFSSSQLPFLMVASQHTQASIQKHSQSQNPTNLMMSKEREPVREKERDQIKEKHKTHNHVGGGFNGHGNHHHSHQPSNLNIIISNSIFNNYHHHPHNNSSNKNY